MLQYELTFTYKLTECFNPGGQHPKANYYLPPLKKQKNGNGEVPKGESSKLDPDEIRKKSKTYHYEQYKKQYRDKNSEDKDDDNADNIVPYDQFEDKYADKNFGDYDVDITLEASPSFVEGERYTIDYDALSSVWKTSVFEIAIHEETGTLKSINISAEDKTAEAIGSATKLLLAGANIINPVEADKLVRTNLRASDAFKGTSKVICTKAANDLVEDRDRAIKALAMASTNLEAVTQEVELLKLTVRFQDPASTVKEIERLINKAKSAEQAVETAQKTLDGLNSKLTVTVKRTWPSEFFEFTEHINDRDKIEKHWMTNPPGGKPLFAIKSFKLAPPVGVIGREIPGHGKNKHCGTYFKDSERLPTPNIMECLMEELEAAIQLVEKSPTKPCTELTSSTSRPTDKECLWKAEEGVTAARNINDDKGVFVRPPVAGELQMCLVSQSNMTHDHGKIPKLPCTQNSQIKFSKTSAIVPQLGQLRFLPFTNGPFSNNALAIEVGQKGHLQKFSYKRSSAQAAGLLGTISDAAKQVEAFQKERADAELKAIQTARAEEIAILDYEIALMEKEQKRLVLENPDASAIAIAEETAALQAQIALLKARKELVELQQKTDN